MRMHVKHLDQILVSLVRWDYTLSQNGNIVILMAGAGKNLVTQRILSRDLTH